MIKIELTERERALLEIGYLGSLSDKRYSKNKVSLEQLVNYTTSSITDLQDWKNEFGLERLKNKYDFYYEEDKKKCKYIGGFWHNGGSLAP